ncbi:hypothetical protein BpHYR1_054417 [Brachionus plicatilis]|uniref:Uncharacterized protein n=1 Tax=Brachionus plicatilis TaxID=10195 RepID=A0A3M7PXU8_BRAPC|nr:hypothetical protein BpHYR1_054417 [Brachionus plicatilis]
MGEMVFIACVKVVFRILRLQYRMREYGNKNNNYLCNTGNHHPSSIPTVAIRVFCELLMAVQ